MVDSNGAHGMQVFDLDATAQRRRAAGDLHRDGALRRVGNTHTISINEETGYAYLVGGEHRLRHDLSAACTSSTSRIPRAPQFVACYYDDGYIHENQCFVYHGPDTDLHRPRDLPRCARLGAQPSTIIDVTNQAAPVRLDSLHYNSSGYSHQAWFTDDQRYILVDDELDEQNGVTPTRTYIFDALDLDNLVLADANGYFTYATPAIDHNLYVRGNFVFQSNYTHAACGSCASTDPRSAQLTEVGYFDLFPASNDGELQRHLEQLSVLRRAATSW